MKTILSNVIEPALRILPPMMTSDKAKAGMLAIGLQESGLHHRKQIRGPAHGLWQFERIGVAEVLRNRKTRDIAIDLCWRLSVAATTAAVYHRIDDDDVLAAGIARLALWRHPDALPERDDPEEGWRQYLDIWRPGKPRREAWNDYFSVAWGLVEGAK
jgi:hypothetical protein